MEVETASVICRTCLKAATEKEFRYIDDSAVYAENVGNIREMLQFSIPELDLYVSAKPAICTLCIKTLVTVYNYKAKCLTSENLIKEYITRNNLIDYNYVNLSCVVAEQAKIKNQMDGKLIKSEIENKIKQYMEEDSVENSNSMDTTESVPPDEGTEDEENLQEMKDVTEETKESPDQVINNSEDLEDNIPLSEVLQRLCSPESTEDNELSDKPDIVSHDPTKSETVTIHKQPEAGNQPETNESKIPASVVTSLATQKYAIIPVNQEVPNPKPAPQKDNVASIPQPTIKPIIFNQSSMSQAVLLPQGFVGGSKPMFIRIDMSKFLAQNQAQKVASVQKEVAVKKETEIESVKSWNEKSREEENMSQHSDSEMDDTDDSDDAFDEDPPVKVKEEAITITADDIADNTHKENTKSTTLPKPKIMLVKTENLLKKPEQSAPEKAPMILKKPSELYSILPVSTTTTSSATKFIIQQTTANIAGSNQQPKFIIQPTNSTVPSQPQIVLNNGTVNSQPKIIIQQNKDGTFKTVPLTTSSTSNTTVPKIIVKPGATTNLQNVIKIVPSELVKDSATNKDVNTLNLESLFKIVQTQQQAQVKIAPNPSGSTAGSTTDDYICPHCPFSTTKVDLLGKHMSSVHPQPGFKVPKGMSMVENYACFLCPFSASTMELLRGHHMNFHADQLGDEQMRNFLSKKKKDRTPASLSKEQTEKELQILEKVMKRPEYACNVCVYTTKDKSNFRKHLFTHGTKPMTCPHCQYNCVSPYQMRRHFKQKHPSHEFNIPKGKPYPPIPADFIKKEVDDDNDYKITLDTLKGKNSVNIDIEGTIL